MSNPNEASGAGSRSRNDNAEWAALKELAQSGTKVISYGAEFDRSPEEIEKHRRLCKKLLEMINRMPAKPSAEEKARRLDSIHWLARLAGLQDDIEDAVNLGRNAVYSDRVGATTFTDDEEMTLTEEEQARYERLREKVIDLTKVAPGALAERFPSHNFLFHGATVDRLERVLQSGELKNGIALMEDDPETDATRTHSGQEGISWSMNQIDALPGSRWHLAGFVAAPEDVLGTEQQLAIPSRPAPYEVLQMSGGVDAEHFFKTKKQFETWGDGSFSLGSKNSVRDNLIRMFMYNPNNTLLSGASVYQYEGDVSPEAMRQYYKLDEQGQIVWDEDIYQKAEVPPALPWMQTLIDRGLLAKNGYEYLDSVDKIVEYCKQDKEFIKRLAATAKNDASKVEQEYLTDLARTEAVRVRPEDMYFVSSHRDLDSWMRVMAHTGVEPKGILLYDDAQIAIENFASDYEGDHEKLGTAIGAAIGVNDEFWKDQLQIDPAKTPRSGAKGQVLLDSAIHHDKSLRMVDGKLQVVG